MHKVRGNLIASMEVVNDHRIFMMACRMHLWQRVACVPRAAGWTPLVQEAKKAYKHTVMQNYLTTSGKHMQITV